MRIEEIDFLIIGATKSATTWLQQSLQQNPAIHMPDPELHYFSRNYDKGQDWYLAQFLKMSDHDVVGEKSNSYMDTPNAARRIQLAVPNAKLIAQLRNPVDRAYSDYCMLFRRGEVGRDIAQYLDPRQASGGRFLTGGLYYRQLQEYLDLFPIEKLLVLFYESVRTEPQKQLDTVHNFLGLGSDSILSPVVKKIKDKTDPIISARLRRVLQPLKPILAPFRSHPVVKGLRSAIAREADYSALKPELCARLTDFYAPEVEKLGKILQRDLSGWLLNVQAVKEQLGSGAGVLPMSEKHAATLPNNQVV